MPPCPPRDAVTAFLSPVVEAHARGRATLVGAGPGAADLLTLRAVEALRAADVVLYDALVDPAVLDHARPEARRINVGKRCGRHSASQAAINRLIVLHCRRGAHVVRLKGGDPFVFGRGGEELETLRAAGVPVAVVPGVTAACAAAASLQVPLTHRSVSRSLHFITGHDRAGALPVHEWAALVRGGGTIAAYMGGRTLATIASALIAAGMPAATPAAAVIAASRAEERHLIATLETLPGALADENPHGPVMILIGEVLSLAIGHVVMRDAA